MRGSDKIANQKSRFVKKKEKKGEVDKITKKINKSAIKMNNRSIDFDNNEDDEDISKFSELKEYNLDEIKLHIVIEKKGKKISTFKTITIKPVDYISAIEGINSAVRKVLKNNNLKLSDYSLSYKVINARGPSSELEDKLDFNEFIDDYKKIIAADKKMSVIVVIGDDPINEKSNQNVQK